MADNRQIRELLDATAYDSAGEKLGSVNEVYINDTTGQPDFIEVNHGMFGSGTNLVPLRGHTLVDGNLNLAFAKDRIADAPNLDGDAHLSNADLDALYAHYGLQSAKTNVTYDVDDKQKAAAANTNTTTDRKPAADQDGVVRSEERLQVDKENVETGQARLRKYVVHDTETVEVPVTREEVRVERTPIDADEAADLRGQSVGEDEASVTLHEERVTVNKETVPVEKVNLEKDVVRDTETVTEDVAKERIEVEGAKDADRK